MHFIIIQKCGLLWMCHLLNLGFSLRSSDTCVHHHQRMHTALLTHVSQNTEYQQLARIVQLEATCIQIYSHVRYMQLSMLTLTFFDRLSAQLCIVVKVDEFVDSHNTLAEIFNCCMHHIICIAVISYTQVHAYTYYYS